MKSVTLDQSGVVLLPKSVVFGAPNQVLFDSGETAGCQQYVILHWSQCIPLTCHWRCLGAVGQASVADVCVTWIPISIFTNCTCPVIQYHRR
jgi:hypothetical protein